MSFIEVRDLRKEYKVEKKGSGSHFWRREYEKDVYKRQQQGALEGGISVLFLDGDHDSGGSLYLIYAGSIS